LIWPGAGRGRAMNRSGYLVGIAGSCAIAEIRKSIARLSAALTRP
jgi:hypothetical protein